MSDELEKAAQDYLDYIRGMARMGKVFSPGVSIKDNFKAGANWQFGRAQVLVEALERIANIDYRGNRSSEIVMAYSALKTYRGEK